MKINKKMIISVIVIFILINLYLCTQVNAGVLVNDVIETMHNTNNGLKKQNIITTIFSTIVAVVQIAVTGYFIIRFTYIGIRYFTLSAAGAKAEYKGELYRTFLWGVVAFAAVQFARIGFEWFNS